MYVFTKIGRHKLEPVIGMAALVVMVLCIAHFFIDLLLLTSYKHAQGEFQRLYLYIHFCCLVLEMLTLIYGFSALSKATYHGVSNFRSWTLFIGVFLFASGFFSTIGFSLDWHKFRDECLANFQSAHNDGGTHDVLMKDEQDCRSTWTALLVTHSVLWSICMTAMGILFFAVNSYKLTQFADEIKRRNLKHKAELRKRNRRQRHARPVRTHTDDEEEVEASESEHYDDELSRLDEKTMHILAERLAVAALASTTPTTAVVPSSISPSPPPQHDLIETLIALSKDINDPDYIKPVAPPSERPQQPQPCIRNDSYVRSPTRTSSATTVHGPAHIYPLNHDRPQAKQVSFEHLDVPKIIVDRVNDNVDDGDDSSPTSGRGLLHFPHKPRAHVVPSAMKRTFTHR